MWQNKRKPLRKGLMALCALVLVAGVAAGCGKKKDEAGTAAADKGQPSEVLVTYKDGQVTRGEFDTFLNVNAFFYKQYAQFKDDPAFQQDMMKQLVTFKILSSRADDKAKAEAEKQFTTQFEEIKGFLNAQEGGMEKQLKDAKLEQKDVEEFVKRSITAIVSEESKVTDQELQTAYNTRLEQDKTAYVTATVRHVLVGINDPATGKETRSKEDALKRAKEVQDKLNKGGDFDALAKEYSDDPGSKEKGGKYENADISQWVPEFKKAAAELPIGKISDPVETSFGYHVMKVESRKTKTLDEVKPELRSAAAETKVYDFVEKELPGLIQTNNLPKPEEKKPAEAPKTDAPSTDASKTEAPKTEAPKTEGGK
ncbi:peptidylprolyl isomerase [Paenibacillus ehimensis]|uniref:Peptidylprolyl isomerase n=1 Tax=Paenibacillus ehimensis TaxID=79264 RepID=A0ABT8VKI8_9BACL|nr:peptidylprolyl isomerase [Paenibacillus ehimensis]MDO3681497.1 peptidylprolyl isomerase [Paenibacillus ehimensis]MEC0213981.1 peptidylprolyl isomerase [Paenibacillus ehimensis]